MDMTEYLMSVAMYSLKYAEEFGYKEDEVSDTLGYIFRVHQDKVKEYSNQELSLLVNLLSKEDKDKYEELLNIYTLDNIKLMIKYAKKTKDILKLAKKTKELYYMNDFKFTSSKLEKEFKGD